MDIVKVSIPRDVVEGLKPEERDFVVSIGYLTNQINVLNKLLLIANRHHGDNEVEESGKVMTIGFLLRVLAGYLSEGWELLQTMYFGSKLSMEYDKKLPGAGAEALVELKRYFSNANLIRTIRSEFAFHIPTGHLQSALDKDQEALEFYIAEATGNCLYMGAESLAMWELVENAGGGDHAAGMNKLFDEILEMSGWYSTFTNNCLLVFSSSSKMESAAVIKEVLQIDDVPDFNILQLPYLIDKSE